jgi:LAO/AO transport system kinase
LADPAALAARVARGDRAAVATALNLVEDRRAASEASIIALLRAIAATSNRPENKLGKRPRAHRVGLTGPPGVGKSSLVAALARAVRRSDRSVGVLAVDPSSPRSGGAVLGDRVRIDPDPEDGELFVRSMAAQGDLGGLARAAAAAIDVLGAAYDVVLVETTGVGQSEIEVEAVVDTTVVVIQPGGGDALQFIKAGILEVADIFLVSKCDLGDPAARARRDLDAALGDTRPILSASAHRGDGVAELLRTIDAHAETVSDTHAARRSRGALDVVSRWIERRFGEHGIERLGGRASLASRAAACLEQGMIPREAARSVGEEILRALRANA